MRYFRIRSPEGVQNPRSGLDEDRGTMRLLSNTIPYPVGTLSSPPQWDRVYENVTPAAGSVQTFTDANSNRVVIGTNNVGQTTNIAFLPPALSYINPEPAGDASNMASYSYNTQSYFSVIDRRVIVGSGDSLYGNKEISSKTSWALADFEKPEDPTSYSNAAYDFPECKTFVVGPQKAVFAAGNNENPLTVFISEPQDILGGGLLGLESGVMSHVTIPLTGATRITALSTFREYVVVHTDAGVVLLTRPTPQQASTGWRVEQISTATNAGASSPNTVSPSLGSSPYYLGTDGQIYRNETEPATDEALQPRAREIASFQAVGQWDADIRNLTGAFSTYDSNGNWYIVGANSDGRDVANGHGWYMMSGDTNMISGPHWYPRFTCIQAIPGSSHLLGVDGDGQFWTTDLRDIREKRDIDDAFVVSETDGPSVTVYESRLDATAVGTDQNQVLSTGMGERFMLNDPFQAESVPKDDNSLNHHYPTPFADRNDAAAEITGTSYENSILSVAETAFEDFGQPESTKHFMEMVLKFDKGSVGYLGAFVETEDGNTDGSWVGSVEGKDTHKIFINVRGRKLRVRLYAATDVAARWILNDISVGFTLLNTL
tara:strand:+ start:1884 stop:3689 length:1806 start_codon:yes stop_codon:yes gene_type:complete